MKTEVLRVNPRICLADMNNLAKGVVNKSTLLSSESNAHLGLLISRMGLLQVSLNAAINEAQVKTNAPELLASMQASYISYYKLVESYSLMPSFSGRSVAQSILAINNRYHRLIVSKKGLMSSASYVSSLIAELKTSEVAASFESLMYVSTALENLENAHAQFVSRYSDYRDNRAKQLLEDNASTLKKALLVFFNQEFVPYLNAMVQASEADYSPYAVAVAALVDARNLVLKQQRARGKEVSSEPID